MLHRRSRLCISIDLWIRLFSSTDKTDFEQSTLSNLPFGTLILFSIKIFLEEKSNRDPFSQTQNHFTRPNHPQQWLSFHHQHLSNATAMTVIITTQAAEGTTKGLSRSEPRFLIRGALGAKYSINNNAMTISTISQSATG